MYIPCTMEELERATADKLMDNREFDRISRMDKGAIDNLDRLARKRYISTCKWHLDNEQRISLEGITVGKQSAEEILQEQQGEGKSFEQIMRDAQRHN